MPAKAKAGDGDGAPGDQTQYLAIPADPPDFAFPILTRDVGAGGQSNGAPGDPGVLASQRISDALGWRWRADDPTAFLAALSGSFTISRVEGHNDVTWRPRGAVQTAIGAATGAQGSLAARTLTTIREALPLLDSLVPLLPDADPEDCAAFRGLVRHDLEELRNELSLPELRLQRIDLLFQLLTGWRPDDEFDLKRFTAAEIGGHLGRLREKFGFLDPLHRRVNTLPEEGNETTFGTLADWAVGLLVGYVTQRGQLDPYRRPGAFLGTTLTVLGGQLVALYDLVDDLEAALDSVLIDEGQRQAIRVHGTALYLNGLLDWIRSVAGHEGKAMIELGGRDAVETSFVPTIEALRDATAHLLVPAPDRGRLMIRPRSDYPAGLYTARVEVAVVELMRTLRITARLAVATFREVRFLEVPDVVVVKEAFEVEVANFDNGRYAFVNVVAKEAPAELTNLTNLGDGRWRLTLATGSAGPSLLQIRRRAEEPSRWHVEDSVPVFTLTKIR